jgi:hypothetical protein
MRFLVNGCREIQYQPCNFKKEIYSGKFLGNFFEKIPMLKWESLVNQVGGAGLDRELRKENKTSWFSQLFSTKPSTLSRSSVRLYIGRTSCGHCDYRRVNRSVVAGSSSGS